LHQHRDLLLIRQRVISNSRMLTGDAMRPSWMPPALILERSQVRAYCSLPCDIDGTTGISLFQNRIPGEPSPVLCSECRYFCREEATHPPVIEQFLPAAYFRALPAFIATSAAYPWSYLK
jgi:hypothetical protein